jgi:putative transposase
MDNHVHFIALPQKENSLAKVFSTAHMRYSQYFNKKGEASGHLWQGRFYSCILDTPYLMAALRYVERNPVRAKMVKKPWQWKWSSAPVHVGQSDGMVSLVELRRFMDVSRESWMQFIDTDENKEDVEAIRKHTMTGRPLGTEGFITKLSRRLGRELRALPRGRPKKTEDK